MAVKEEQEIEEEVTPEEEDELEEIVIEPPEDDEPTGTEESQKEPEPKKEEDSYEKRYKDLQSHADKKEARYKKLLAPFEKNLIEDENGDLSFKFDDTPIQKKEDILEPATDDEWLDDPRLAAEKDYKFRRAAEKKEEAESKRVESESKAAEDSKKTYETERAGHWTKAQELYPEAKDKESALFKKAQEILESDPAMSASPRCDLLAVKEAAAELGVTPQGKKPKKDATYIISGSSGSGVKKAGNLSDEEFDALSTDEQNKYMEQSVFKDELKRSEL